MIEITYDSALAALKAAVREKGGDYVYNPGEDEYGYKLVCRYLHEDENGVVPGCLVGNAMLRLGVTEEQIDDYNTGSDAYDLMNNLAADGVIAPVGRKTRDLFQLAQGEQDRGKTWGKALSHATWVIEEREASGDYDN